MVSGAFYWVFLGVVYLVWMTVQDYRNGMLIDDRKNYFMFGLSISLLSHFSRPFWYVLVVFAVTVGLGFLLARVKGFGRGDVNAVSWAFWGFGIIGLFEVAFYGVSLIFCSLVYHFFKLKVFKVDKPTPFFGVLLICFILTVVVFQIF